MSWLIREKTNYIYIFKKNYKKNALVQFAKNRPNICLKAVMKRCLPVLMVSVQTLHVGIYLYKHGSVLSYCGEPNCWTTDWLVGCTCCVLLVRHHCVLVLTERVQSWQKPWLMAVEVIDSANRLVLTKKVVLQWWASGWSTELQFSWKN